MDTLTDAVETVLSSVALQRALDNVPCSTCGGDRLRPDHTHPGPPCHAPWTRERTTP